MRALAPLYARQQIDLRPLRQFRLPAVTIDPAIDRHRHAAREVPDPYYGGTQGFETVLDLVEDASDGLLRALGVARR